MQAEWAVACSYTQLRAVTRSYTQLRAVTRSYTQLRAVTRSYTKGGAVGRCLIVANQTLGGQELEDAIVERIEAGQEFYVVVPMIEPEAEAVAWVPPDPAFGIPMQPQHTTDALEDAAQRSNHRLQAVLDKIHKRGGEADGEIGPTDPLAAVDGVVDRVAFDEIVVSTLPPGLSRWLRMDLPSRIARAVEVPVTTIEALERG